MTGRLLLPQLTLRSICRYWIGAGCVGQAIEPFEQGTTGILSYSKGAPSDSICCKEAMYE
jgi:hypothetical protein